MVMPSTFNNNQLFLNLIGIKQVKYLLNMRSKVSIINDLGIWHEETVIANNKNEAKKNVLSINPKSNILNAKGLYK